MTRRGRLTVQALVTAASGAGLNAAVNYATDENGSPLWWLAVALFAFLPPTLVLAWRTGRSEQGNRDHRGVFATLFLTIAVFIALVNIPFRPPEMPFDPCSAVAGQPGGTANGVLEVGTLFPIEGPLKPQNEQLAAAVDAAVYDIQDNGGIGPSRSLRISGANRVDEGDPASIATCKSTGDLLARGVDAIIGPAASINAKRAITRLGAASTVIVSPASTAPELSTFADNGRFFRTVPSDVLQGRLLGDLVVGDGNTVVTVIARDDTYGRGLQAEILDELNSFELPEAIPVLYKPVSAPGQTDYRDALSRVTNQQSRNPTARQAVVLVGFDELGSLVSELLPGSATIYGTDGFLRSTFAGSVPDVPGQTLEGIRGTRPYADPGLENSFAARGIPDALYASQAYDATIILALASFAANSDNPKDFDKQITAVTRGGKECKSFVACIGELRKNRLADINYQGRSGSLDFTSRGEPCQADYSIVQFDQMNKLRSIGRGNGTYLCTGLQSLN